MSEDIYSKWDSQYDLQGLVDDAASSDDNQERKEVPVGLYETKVTKIEIVESKKGDPMLSIWFRIVSGDYKGQMLFYNQVITAGFTIKKACDMLSAISHTDVKFESFSQLQNVCEDIFNGVDGVYEYALEYSVNSKGFNTYEIKESFNV